MTGDYLVISWPAASDDARREVCHRTAALEAAGWGATLDRPGLAVLTRGDRPPPIAWSPAFDAVLIGRVFQRAGMSRNVVATASPVDRARELCRSHWGSYVAILSEASDAPPLAFRDPSGAMDCLTWRSGQLRIAASGLRDLPRGFLPAEAALDWDIITDFLRRPPALSAFCALRGFTAVTPGDLHRLGAAPEAGEAIWRPATWAAHAAEGPDLAERLRHTVEETVQTLISSHATIFTELSGGLDSTIVNAAIVAGGLAGRVAATLHYVGDRAEGDERLWAEAAAAEWGLPLLAVRREAPPVCPEEDFGPLVRDARPPINASDTWRDRDTAERLCAGSATALVTGQGGDAVFFQAPTAKVLADLWRQRGWRAAQDPVVTEVARWLRRSVWSVAAEAVGLHRRRGGSGFAIGRFAGPRMRQAPTGPAHPWLADLEVAPPAKRLQIQALTAGQFGHALGRRRQAAEVIHPLLAQPVVELCLSIPAWELVRGGRDRALARRAFAGRAPQAILERRSKGGLTSFYARGVAASLDVLRHYLLDGVLADAGVLDQAAMAEALQPDHLIWRADALGLVRAACLEAWVRYWQTQVADAPGAAR